MMWRAGPTTIPWVPTWEGFMTTGAYYWQNGPPPGLRYKLTCPWTASGLRI